MIYSNIIKPSFYKQLRRRLRLLVSTQPLLYTLYARFENLQFQLSDKTTIVVDSYPRSANSFFEAAFTRADGGRETVAHHSHAAAQVLTGVKRGLPCIVLLREPEAAIASFYEMNSGDYPISLCTDEFIAFYAALLPVVDKLIIIETNEIEVRFHDLMTYLRDQYNLKVDPYEIDPITRSELFLAVDKTGHYRNGNAKERYSETLSIEEKRTRREQLEAIRKQIRSKENALCLSQAKDIYDQFKLHRF